MIFYFLQSNFIYMNTVFDKDRIRIYDIIKRKIQIHSLCDVTRTLLIFGAGISIVWMEIRNIYPITRTCINAQAYSISYPKAK